MIRPATPEDLPAIKGLALRAWLHTYRDILPEAEIRAENEKFYTAEFHAKILRRCETGNHLFNLLELESSVRGLMDFDYDETRCWLMRFYLDPDVIGKGHGRALMEHSEAQLAALGRREYFLHVHKDNALGRGFYEKHGYERHAPWDSEEDGEFCYRKAIRVP